jgi:hypothetical protein
VDATRLRLGVVGLGAARRDADDIDHPARLTSFPAIEMGV